MVIGRRGCAAPLPKILANRVSCMRSNQVVLRDINMSLHSGGAMLLTGPNGSGKSTFLRLLAGFIKPTSGRLIWDGNDLSLPGMYDFYQVQIHLVAAKDAIKTPLTVHENVSFWETLEGGSGRTTGALEYVGLGRYAQEKASILSMGQRKRLQLARMLAIPRSIWLLDEPSVGLDSQGVQILEHMMQEHRRNGGVVVVATHVPINLEDCMHLRFPHRENRPCI